MDVVFDRECSVKSVIGSVIGPKNASIASIAIMMDQIILIRFRLHTVVKGFKVVFMMGLVLERVFWDSFKIRFHARRKLGPLSMVTLM